MNRIEKLLLNDARWPSMYDGIFLEQGLVNYKDLKLGIGHLPKDTIDGMLNSFVGKPVVIYHQDVTAKNCNDYAVGWVINAFFDSNLGKYRVQFIVTKDEAHEKIKNGYELSCAYDILDRGPGGRWHALNYDFEIKRGEFTHLALVPNPRYEDSTIKPMDIPVLVNSFGPAVLKPLKEEDDMNLLKLFGVKNEKDRTLENSFIEIDGKKVSLKELTNAHLEAMKQAEQEVTELNPESEIEIKNSKGEPVKLKVADLVNSYKKVTNKSAKNCSECDVKDGEPHLKNCSHYKKVENESEEDKEKRLEAEKDEKSDPKEKEKAENARIEAKAQEIINSKIEELKKSGRSADAQMFKILQAANQSPVENDSPTTIGNSMEDKLKRGKDLCGSAEKK